jgi:hypothetical protein
MAQQVKANPPGAPKSPNGVNLTVIVYDRRPLVPGVTPGTLQEEVPCFGIFNLTSTQVTLTWTGQAPPLKRGSWILDCSVPPQPPTTTPTTSTPTTTPNAFFYRVVNVVIPGSAGVNSADVELHTGAQANGSPNSASGTPIPNVVVMDSVAEVFYKGTVP